jgi:hypothetical protein
LCFSRHRSCSRAALEPTSSVARLTVPGLMGRQRGRQSGQRALDGELLQNLDHGEAIALVNEVDNQAQVHGMKRIGEARKFDPIVQAEPAADRAGVEPRVKHLI